MIDYDLSIPRFRPLLLSLYFHTHFFSNSHTFFRTFIRTSFAFTFLQVKKFDANKLYCSEILSILLQAHESNQVRVCALQGDTD
jgi:hypothetical protein